MSKQTIIETHRKRSLIPHRRDPVIIDIPKRQQATRHSDPATHQSYFAVVRALEDRRIHGNIVAISSKRMTCNEWQDLYTVEIGYYWYQRRVLFCLVER